MTLRFQSVRVATDSEDTESLLVFASDSLVAVLVCLSDSHNENAGRWFLEAGFGRLNQLRQSTFANLDEAQAWMIAALANDAS